MDADINAVACVVHLCSSLKVSCLEAQREHPLVAAMRQNTEVDLEEDVEADSDSLSRFPLLFPCSRSCYDLTPQDEHKKQRRSSKG